ncbi:MAG TPA: SUMF1/EgtB/PvdO family nonheme iron enzyme, partial [Pirellulaceae bacterium]|nr:SUMF1/EgtB/PvdO family nonheme iron enzyme [Pirellulaceae bacterium]
MKNWKVIGSTLLMVGVAAILWNIHPWLFGIGLIALTSVASIVGWSYSRRDAAQLAAEPHRRPSISQPPVVSTQPDAAEDTGDLIEQMLKQGRYALLLRPQIVANLATEQMQRALAELDERMALVPNGDVVLRASRYEPGDEDDLSALERVVRVDPLFLDRYPVTNRQYKAFVDAGGYEQISLWDSSVWPAILDFVDSTGHSGPRYWKDGAYPSKEEDHPVVGICWYEANAYARWVGKRLPTDPEWVKAGGWP